MKILISGTSSGIGNYLASFLKEDYKITGVSRSQNNIDYINHIKGDLRNEKTLDKIADLKEDFDYIIINAGVGYFGEFQSIENKSHKEIIETNLLSPILLINKLLNKNKIKKGIIFLGSIASKKSFKLGASYSASKFGLRGFAMSLKNEYKNLKIHIINPSIVKTNFHKKSSLDFSFHKENSREEILEIVKNIINKKENRFEVDV